MGQRTTILIMKRELEDKDRISESMRTSDVQTKAVNVEARWPRATNTSSDAWKSHIPAKKSRAPKKFEMYMYPFAIIKDTDIDILFS